MTLRNTSFASPPQKPEDIKRILFGSRPAISLMFGEPPQASLLTQFIRRFQPITGSGNAQRDNASFRGMFPIIVVETNVYLHRVVCNFEIESYFAQAVADGGDEIRMSSTVYFTRTNPEYILNAFAACIPTDSDDEICSVDGKAYRFRGMPTHHVTAALFSLEPIPGQYLAS